MKLLLILTVFYRHSVSIDHIPFENITMQQCERIGERYAKKMEASVIQGWEGTVTAVYVCEAS